MSVRLPMLSAMAVLRADPWSPQYGMGYEAPLEEPPLPRVDPFVERADWSSALAPEPQEDPTRPVIFVDGVRRIDLRLLADDADRRVPGLFGSYAVGSVHCDGHANFGPHDVRRAVVLAGGLRAERASVPCGASTLEFEPALEARGDPNAPLQRLQDLMRETEAALAARLVGDGAKLVLVDGPLALGDGASLPLVGVVKRFVRRYLGPEQESLLSRLAAGERTPLFALIDEGGAPRTLSWYARLTELRPPWHDHAGIVRCEVRASVSVPAAVSLADRVTALLPRFAGRAADPRTPQNLAPVAGLETWLRHRMGDQAMTRRALLAWLATKER